MNQLQVLIVGPYQFVGNSVRMQHAETAQNLATQVMMKGHTPIYGHWLQDFRVQIDHNNVMEQIYGALDICDAVLIFGQSRDIQAFVEKAEALERAVYYDVNDIPG